jgi:hypothetical protein
MKYLSIIIIYLGLYSNLIAQTKVYSLLLCTSYNQPGISYYSRGGVLPGKIFCNLAPRNLDNFIEESIKSNYINLNSSITGTYLLFYDSERTLNDLYSLGIIHFPFVPDSNLINNPYIEAITDLRYINAHCRDFKHLLNIEIFQMTNISGLQFSMNLFDTEFYDLYPFYPISIACVPVKLYGEIVQCTTSRMNIPNWNRNFPNDSMTINIDSIPVYKINKFDSISFYTGDKIISKRNKKYLIVNSNYRFKENIKYYKVLNRNYLKKGKYNKRNLPVFKSDYKLSFYFNVK